MEPRYRAKLLLAAFAGLRLAEVCRLRVSDVDFVRGIVHPVAKYPADPLKTEMSRTPIPHHLVLELSAHVEQFSTEWVMCDEVGRQMGPWQLQRAFRAARSEVPGLPEGFRFHDLRHYYASLLISSALDVKVVQARLGHASAKTTLDTYGHLWRIPTRCSRSWYVGTNRLQLRCARWLLMNTTSLCIRFVASVSAAATS